MKENSLFPNYCMILKPCWEPMLLKKSSQRKFSITDQAFCLHLNCLVIVRIWDVFGVVWVVIVDMILDCLDDIFNCRVLFLLDHLLHVAGIAYSPVASDMLANVFWSYFWMCWDMLATSSWFYLGDLQHAKLHFIEEYFYFWTSLLTWRHADNSSPLYH